MRNIAEELSVDPLSTIITSQSGLSTNGLHLSSNLGRFSSSLKHGITRENRTTKIYCDSNETICAEKIIMESDYKGKKNLIFILLRLRNQFYRDVHPIC